MALDRSVIRFVQSQLKYVERIDPGPIDGVLGRRTEAALDQIIEARPSLRGTFDKFRWSVARKAVLYVQDTCNQLGLSPGPYDGYWGPMTAHAYDEMVRMLSGRERTRPFRDEPDPPKTDIEPDGPFPVQRHEDLVHFYGQPGDMTKQTLIEPPYPMKLAWDPGQEVKRIRCHELVADSVIEVLKDVLAAYGQKQITHLALDMYGGMLNVRKMRGGTKWSMHAWGIAIDIDPEHNQLRWNNLQARMASPHYDDWWRIWEGYGWTSLGRKRNFDWMHIQAARLL